MRLPLSADGKIITTAGTSTEWDTKSRVEKDGSPAFGEAFIASATPQQSGVVGTIGIANADIFRSANAELGAIFIGTAELVEIIREWSSGLHILENLVV